METKSPRCYSVTMDTVVTIQPLELAGIIKCKSDKILTVDSRTFCEYNTSHILNSVNVWSSKIRKKRLQQNSISVFDYLQQACQFSLQDRCLNEVVVYDQSASSPTAVPPDSFLHVLLLKLSSAFDKVYLLAGGFLEFQSLYPELCEDSTQKASPLTSLSQPCLPVAKNGPTRILPFLFLGSQHDANNKQLLLEHNIAYELNVSTSCPKPDFLQDSHFMRIAVNDNFSEKLLPYFGEAFRFIDKVREIGGRVLVHCLAGISRSPTVAIAFVMKHLRLHYDEAYRYVKNRRPTISPNINFVGQLLELDRQLLGDGVLYRSPTAPLYLDHDFASFDLTPSVDSLVLKSSSSSCIESNKERDFPFSLKRSTPSLRLKSNLDSMPSSPTRSSPSSPSSAFASLSLLSGFKNKDTSQEYVSDRLPSTPVTPPGSPEFFSSYSVCESCPKSAKLSSSPSFDSGISVTKTSFRETSYNKVESDDKEFNHDIKPQTCNYSMTSNSNNNGSSNSSANNIYKPEYQNSSNRGSFSTTASINLECHSDAKYEGAMPDKHSSNKSLCVLEVTHETSPVTYIDVQDKEPIIIRETQVVATPVNECEERNPSVKRIYKSCSVEEANCEVRNINEKRHHSQPLCRERPRVFIPQKPYIPSTPAEENNNVFTPSTVTPPIFPKTPNNLGFSTKKIETKHLPRSYSSSETHLNTRRLLESHAGNTTDVYTRKSFSSDEVGRGFQSSCKPLSPVVFNKDTLMTSPSELARCDSWSTSGLGSEISDWDSLQDDNHSILTDDTQGPFDAVFADVFPGELQDSVFKESFKKLPGNKSKEYDIQESKLGKTIVEQKHYPLKQHKKHQNQNENQQKYTLSSSSSSSSLKTTLITPKEALGTSPTPRPVSLPGVTGTYNVSQKGPDLNANIDMGVELDDSPDWQSEKGHEVFQFNPSRSSQKPFVMEHPPVNPRTMGEDVKHIRELPTKHSGAVKSSSKDPEEISSDLHEVNANQPPPVNEEQARQIMFRRRSLNNEDGQNGNEEAPSKDKPLEVSPTPKNSSCNYEDDTEPNVGGKICTDVKVNVDLKGRFPEDKHSLEDRWRWWDNEFKKKIKNIQKNVSLTSWDPIGEFETEAGQEEVTASDNMAGFHLAQELMQSMEDLLESEICDIKRQASALSTRFGLRMRSPSPDSKANSSTPGTSSAKDSVRGRRFSSSVSFPPIFQGVTRSNRSQNLHCSSINFSPSNSPPPKENKLRKEEPQHSANHTELPQAAPTRAKSEPPLCMEEGLYRVRSCPGIPQGQSEDSKEKTPSTGAFCVSLRTSRPTTLNREPNRYSCGALDFLSPTLPSFESCPDISQLKPFFPDNASASSGASCSSSTHSSFSRLLQVS